MVIKSTIKGGLFKASKSVIIIGILAIILGIVALIYPNSVGVVSTIAIGIFLIIGGVIRLIFSFMSFTFGSMFLKILYALLMMGVGVWIAANPEMGLDALTMVMAIYFIADGITAVFYSFSLMPIGGGWYVLLSGIIGAALGIMILFHWPVSSNYALGIYIGIKLIVDGLMLSLAGSAVRKAAK